MEEEDDWEALDDNGDVAIEVPKQEPEPVLGEGQKRQRQRAELMEDTVTLLVKSIPSQKEYLLISGFVNEHDGTIQQVDSSSFYATFPEPLQAKQAYFYLLGFQGIQVSQCKTVNNQAVVQRKHETNAAKRMIFSALGKKQK